LMTPSNVKASNGGKTCIGPPSECEDVCPARIADFCADMEQIGPGRKEL